MNHDLSYDCRDNRYAPRVIKLLEAGADINGPVNYNKDTALIVAIRAGATDIVTLLVERGADVNVGGGFINQRPLQWAINYNRYGIITYLLDHHADVTLTDDNNGTALHYAALYDNIETITRLLAMGAVVDAKNNQEETPLHNTFALHVIGWKENGMLLLANGADINTQDMNGDTILHRSLTKIKRIRFLLDNGASVEIKNKEGQTPVDGAFILNALYSGSGKYEPILTLLQDHRLMGTLKNAGRRK